MRLENLFPPAVLSTNEVFPSAVQILHAAISHIHLERRNARNVGFRGVRPFSMSSPDSISRDTRSSVLIQGWTCRIIDSPLLFAVLFLNNDAPKKTTLNLSFKGSTQWSSFAVFGFPPKDSDLLEKFSLQALNVVMQDGYESKIHEWTFSPEECMPFHLGTIYMGLHLEQDGQAKILKENQVNHEQDALNKYYRKLSMTLLLEAKARQRLISLEGIAYEENGEPHWLIMPNGYDADIPAFSLIKPLFDTLGRTLGTILQSSEEEAYSMHCTSASSDLAYDAQGQVSELENKQGSKYRATMVHRVLIWGENLVETKKMYGARPFSLEAKKGCLGERPLLHIISGFLGSGKTTFLREWLAYLQNKDIYMGVIQNEFGQMGLDATLLKEDTVVEALDEGCVCCSLADSLRPGIKRIQNLMPRQDILLETSGLANPNNVATALKDLDDLLQQGLIIGVSDAKLLQQSIQRPIKPAIQQGADAIIRLDLQGLALSQIECVDILVLNKIDLIHKEDIELLRQALRFHNPRAVFIESSFGRIPFALLDEVWDAIQQKRSRLKEKALLKPVYLMNYATHLDDPSGAYSSRLIQFPHAMPKDTIEKLINDSDAIRVKGIVEIHNEGMCIVQNAASITLFSPIYLDPDAGNTQKNYLVFIGKQLNNTVLNNFDHSKHI